MEVYSETIQRLEAATNELADCTHMVASAQINLTTDFVGQDHLQAAIDYLQHSIELFKTQLSEISEEHEKELETVK